MYDALKMVHEKQPFNNREQLLVHPKNVIPATVARIQEVLATRWQLSYPMEIVNENEADPTATPRRMIEQCQQVPAEVWPLTLKELEPLDPEANLKTAAVWAARRQVRAFALQLAWSWFKRALVLANGGPVLLHISKDPTYKE